MPRLHFVTLDVFTTTRYLGNPLAVVRIPKDQQQHVTKEQMQRVAREFNLSETIFLVEDEGEGGSGVQRVPEWRVRIFLTHSEITFAGHPTIGCAVYAVGTLAKSNKGRFISNAGPIDLNYANGAAEASIPHNFHLHSQYPFTTEEVYTLQPSLIGTLATQDALSLISPVKGMNFLAVEVPSLDALALVSTGASPKPQLDDAWNAGFTGSYFWALTSSSTSSGSSATNTTHIQARMIEGALEDPATGSAACALACHLALQKGKSREQRFEICQGVEMGRKSDIGVRVTLTEALDAVEKVVLSGAAVQVMEGTVEC